MAKENSYEVDVRKTLEASIGEKILVGENGHLFYEDHTPFAEKHHYDRARVALSIPESDPVQRSAMRAYIAIAQQELPYLKRKHQSRINSRIGYLESKMRGQEETRDPDEGELFMDGWPEDLGRVVGTSDRSTY